MCKESVGPPKVLSVTDTNECVSSSKNLTKLTKKDLTLFTPSVYRPLSCAHFPWEDQ